jgi:hypothetical protein
MKSQSMTVVIFLLLLLPGGALASSAQQQSGEEHKLSRSEVKALLKSASSPDDHLKLAAYFKDEALQEEAAAKFHDEMAALYESNPPSQEGKSAKEMKGHSRYLAKNARKAAEAARKNAAYQERFAQMLHESEGKPHRSSVR